MDVYELIKKKRDGNELTEEELNFLVNGYIKEQIPDYQMAAFLMAVYFEDMTAEECVNFTKIMVDSGDKVDLSGIEGFKVDKHSTGGVGDTTTLVLAPLVAASGGTVAKMTGRALGHTGGTVDKLESIPNFKVELPAEDFMKTVNDIGVSLIAQTAKLAPADKLIYALRDSTATVDSIPLIAASIMSKKLAAGSNGIVLDVKTGVGAFMAEYEDALELAKTMVQIGEGAGRRVAAIITSMEQPLGFAIGNGIEVAEAIRTLKGDGPRDLVELVLELGSNMLLISGVVSTREEGKERLRKNIENGKVLEKMKQLIEAQGGNPDVVDNPELLPQPKEKIEIKASKSGWVGKINALEVGMASKVLGAGRKTKDAPMDLSIGIYLKKKVGDKVEKGEPLAVFYSDGDSEKLEPAKERFLKAYTISEDQVEAPKFFYARVLKDKVEEF